MAKGTLVFTLPEEEVEFREAQESGAWKSLVLDVLNHLRAQTKHCELSDEKRAAYEEMSEMIWASIEDRGLKMT